MAIRIVVSCFLLCLSLARAEDAPGRLQSLEGSWIATAVATGVPLPPLQTLMTFQREGTVIESRRLYVPASPLGPVLSTPGHGEWIRTANGQFAVTSVLFYQAAPNVPTADGTLLGTEKGAVATEPVCRRQPIHRHCACGDS